jgi:glycosyltransferase involved in cell wall biosynthesis
MKILYLTSHLSEIRGGPLLMLNFAKSVKAIEPNITIALISLEEKPCKCPSAIPYNNIKVSFFHADSSHGSHIFAQSIHKSPLSSLAMLSSYKTLSFDFNRVNHFLEVIGKNYDIIHGESWQSPYTVSRAFFLNGKPLNKARFVCHVLFHPTIYADPSSTFTKLFGRKLSIPLRAFYEQYSLKEILSRIDASTTSTPYEYKLLRKMNLDNVYFVGEGIDIDFIHNNIHLIFEKSGKIRRESGGKNTFLYIGGKSYLKGYYHFLEAIRLMVKDRKDVTFISIGKLDSNDPYVYIIKSLESKLISEGYLKTYENISEIEKFATIMASDVIVLPSARETIPLVFLEAWALKKPVIGSLLPTISSVALSGEKSAHLVNFGNVKELKDAMNVMIEDKRYAHRLGNAGYRKVIETYNLKSIGERLIKVYKKIL